MSHLDLSLALDLENKFSSGVDCKTNEVLSRVDRENEFSSRVDRENKFSSGVDRENEFSSKKLQS